MIKILVVEDDEDMRLLLRTQLEEEGYVVDEADDLVTASHKIEANIYDAFLLDVRLPDGDSICLFDRFPAKLESRSIVVTANPSIPDVVEAIKKGAFNYLEKPVEEDLLIAQLQKIIHLNRMQKAHQTVLNEVASCFNFGDIIHESEQMKELLKRAEILAGTGNTVLVQGETGAGKEVLAQSIHNGSQRRGEIFLPLNCASIPTELFESELFGFEKGAFTGAVDNYSGRFIQADKGTLFLDEIGELPLPIQAKLLRILDDGAIFRLKSKKSVHIDVRLIAATNRDLKKEVKSKQFRADLYYRLKESSITIPPLRQRVEDILPLVYHFIQVYNNVYKKQVERVSREAENYLLNYPWEGNVRELKNAIKSIIPFKTNDTIDINDLSFSIIEKKDTREKEPLALEEVELRHIRKVLKLTDFNITRAAELMGISRPRMYRKIKKLDLEDAVEE